LGKRYTHATDQQLDAGLATFGSACGSIDLIHVVSPISGQRWKRAPEGLLLPWIMEWQFWQERPVMRLDASDVAPVVAPAAYAKLLC
jgi:hypothetical protein